MPAVGGWVAGSEKPFRFRPTASAIAAAGSPFAPFPNPRTRTLFYASDHGMPGCRKIGEPQETKGNKTPRGRQVMTDPASCQSCRLGLAVAPQRVEYEGPRATDGRLQGRLMHRRRL